MNKMTNVTNHFRVYINQVGIDSDKAEDMLRVIAPKSYIWFRDEKDEDTLDFDVTSKIDISEFKVKLEEAFDHVYVEVGEMPDTAEVRANRAFAGGEGDDVELGYL